MKEIEKKKKVQVIQTDVNYNLGCSSFGTRSTDVITTLQSDSLLTGDNYVEVIVKELVPETLVEFRRTHELTKDELLNWLNDNYK